MPGLNKIDDGQCPYHPFTHVPSNLPLTLPPPSNASFFPQTKSTKATKITINTTQPAKDTVLEASNLVKYLTDRIKVKGKAGALGKDVEVALDKKDAYLVSVSSSGDVSLSKRYIKYREWFSLSYWGGWVVPSSPP